MKPKPNWIGGRTEAPGIEYISIMPVSPEHPQHHHADLVELPDRSLLMVWLEFNASKWGRYDQAPSNISTLRSHDGGRTWGEYHIELTTGPGDQNIYHPSLLLLPDNELLMFSLTYHKLEWDQPLDASGYLRRSRDFGRTWSEPTTIWSHTCQSGTHQNLIRLASGRLLKSVEESAVWGAYPKCVAKSGCYLSDDNGHTWQAPKCWITLPLRGSMESTIAETHGGELVMAMRNQLGSVFLSRSQDQGVTWSKPQTSGLMSPESMPRITRIPTTGDLLLVWNHSEFDPSAGHFGFRSPLSTAVSRDGGRTWGPIRDIEDDPRIAFSNFGCSFTDDGRLFVMYNVTPGAETREPAPSGADSVTGGLKAAMMSIDWLYGTDQEVTS
jgi:sialidase-1